MSDWRRRILQGRAQELTDWLESQDSGERTEDDVDSEQRSNWLDAVRTWDPGANLNEELVIRLMGESAGQGGLRFAVGDALLKPLQEGVTVSSDKDVELELVGISSGSTVLHVRPVTRNSDTLEEVTQRDDSAVTDEAMNVLLDAVGTLEAREDVTEWTPMLASLSRLVTALDRFDLSVQMRWLSPSGNVRSSSLTEVGRRYVRDLRKTHERAFQPTRRHVSGQVRELKLPGSAVVKPASSPAITVKFEPGQITEAGMQLGEYVHLMVEERGRLTKRGGRPVVDYVFVGFPEHGDEESDPPDVPVSVREIGTEEDRGAP